MADVSLRVMTDADLAVLIGGDSRFDDWGPVGPRREPMPSNLSENAGGLTIESDGAAGLVSWHYTQGGPGSASRFPNIGIWMPASHRGRGIGSQAQRQLAELFFAHTNVNRVEASTDVENLAEQRALERAGFQREGVLRGAQWREGGYHDMCVYAVLRADLAPASA